MNSNLQLPRPFTQDIIPFEWLVYNVFCCEHLIRGVAKFYIKPQTWIILDFRYESSENLFFFYIKMQPIDSTNFSLKLCNALNIRTFSLFYCQRVISQVVICSHLFALFMSILSHNYKNVWLIVHISNVNKDNLKVVIYMASCIFCKNNFIAFVIHTFPKQHNCNYVWRFRVTVNQLMAQLGKTRNHGKWSVLSVCIFYSHLRKKEKLPFLVKTSRKHNFSLLVNKINFHAPLWSVISITLLTMQFTIWILSSAFVTIP